MSTGTSCHFGHLLQVSKTWSLILYIFFFHNFIHVYSPGVGADSPEWTKFWCQQKLLVTSFICCKFQKNVFKVWFYTIFFMIQYMYIAPGQGQTALRGQNFDVNRNFLSLHIFVASFKEISLSLSNFVQLFSWFNTCIQHQGRGHKAPRGQSFDVNRNFLSLRSSVASLKSIDDNSFWKIHCFTFFPYKSIRDQIWPCRKICQRQSRVIIWTNLVVSEHPMLHTKFQGHRPFGSGEDF